MKEHSTTIVNALSSLQNEQVDMSTVTKELSELKTYIKEAKEAEWEFNIERDSNSNISKIKAVRTK